MAFDRIISISVRVFALVVPQHDERELISLGYPASAAHAPME